MKYYIWALGCAMNKSDAERIASVFESAGFSVAKSEYDADVIVTVACSVRQHAIDRIYGKAEKWNKIKSEKTLTTILSGCVLETDKKKMAKMFDLIFEIGEIEKLNDFLKSKIQSPDNFFEIHPKYESTFQAYVPISTGCDNFCTYCAVPYTRGREISRPADEIIAEVKDLVKKGYKEITLLGQNVNSYGNDLKDGTTFTDLIKKVDEIEGIYRVYFYSNHPKDLSDELINIIPKTTHFPHYIHLPLQSGSNKILRSMNRHYNQKQYLELAERIKKNIPEVAITTDIIVGFPGETEKDFRETIEVVKEVGFSMPFIAKYSPRPGTVAAKQKDDVSKTEKEKRWRELTDIQKKILEKENKKLVGRILTVLIDSEKKGKYYGRTDSYKVVEISSSVIPTDFAERRAEESLSPKKQTGVYPEEIRRGQFVNVEIIGASAWMLKGIITV